MWAEWSEIERRLWSVKKISSLHKLWIFPLRGGITFMEDIYHVLLKGGFQVGIQPLHSEERNLSYYDKYRLSGSLKTRPREDYRSSVQRRRSLQVKY